VLQLTPARGLKQKFEGCQKTSEAVATHTRKGIETCVGCPMSANRKKVATHTRKGIETDSI